MVNNALLNIIKMVTAVIVTVGGFVFGLYSLFEASFNTGSRFIILLIIGVAIFIAGPIIGFKIIRTVGEK